MMVRLLRVFTAGVIFVFAAGAQAQDKGPWYVAAGAGGAWYTDERLSGAATGKISMDTGFIGNVAIGRYLDDIRVFRLEIEGIYSRAGIDNNGTANTGGDIANAALMFNLIYDIHTGSSWTPYLGVGIGPSQVFLDNYSVAGVPVADDSGTAFSGQFKGGVAYQLNPSMAVTVQYRLYGTDNVSWKGVGGGTISSNGTLVQSAEVGFRFHF